MYVQWKGTDVCLDFTCACGYCPHYDGPFAYYLRCAECGRTYRMPDTYRLDPVQVDDGTAVQEPWEGFGEHPRREGPEVVDVIDGGD